MSDTVFETERLIVRRPRMSDAEVMYGMYTDPEVMRFLGGGLLPESLDQQRERLQVIMQKYSDPKFGYWPIIPKGQEEMVGAVLLKNLPDSEKIEVGWHLGRANWGKGYASEAAKGAVRHGFEVAGLEVIYAVLFAENTRSAAVTQRLGMRHIGQTEEFYGVLLELYQLRRDEWALQEALGQ